MRCGPEAAIEAIIATKARGIRPIASSSQAFFTALMSRFAPHRTAGGIAGLSGHLPLAENHR
jgi:hypothetical protein